MKGRAVPAQRIQDALQARGLSARSLAQQARISETTAQRLCNGLPTAAETQRKVLKVLETQPAPQLEGLEPLLERIAVALERIAASPEVAGYEAMRRFG